MKKDRSYPQKINISESSNRKGALIQFTRRRSEWFSASSPAVARCL
jgi:hypothetical protein